MSKDVVAADTDQLGVEFREVAPFITEGAYFGRSATRPIRYIERQDYVRALLGGQLPEVAPLIMNSLRRCPGHREIRRRLPYVRPACRSRILLFLSIAQERNA